MFIPPHISPQGKRILFAGGFTMICLVCGLIIYAGYTRFSTSAIRFRASEASTHKPSYRLSAVILFLVSPDRMTEALRTMQAVEDRFNHRLQYPYVIITETEPSEELQEKAHYITGNRTTFAPLPEDMWGLPAHLDPTKVQESVDRLGFTLDYRSMCRFFSGFFWKHPAIQRYEWIWRIDVDTKWHCDIPYDPIALMEESGKLYGFQHINRDALEVQESLASNTSTFLAEYAEMIPDDRNLRFQWTDPAKALAGNVGTEDWLRWTFNNNWEISHRSLWESPLYSAFFRHLDVAGGFFYERWGDAPVHSLAVSFTLRKDQVMYFNDTGYQHQGWEYNCPDLPRCGCYKDPASLKWRDNSHIWFDA